MIKRYPANERNFFDIGWMRGSRSFSFGDYYDPDNAQFGVMRVCNEDEIAPGRGFGAHPHSDMEIVTIVLKGRLKHEDNLGNMEVTSAGEIQRMTAGSGIVHAEYNDSETEEGHFLQLWFMPRERGLTPSYEVHRYDQEKLVNAFLPIVTPEGTDGTAMIHQDMSIHLGRVEAGKRLYYSQKAGRRVFLMLIEGAADVNNIDMMAKDSLRAEFEPEILIKAKENTFVMLIDMP